MSQTTRTVDPNTGEILMEWDAQGTVTYSAPVGKQPTCKHPQISALRIEGTDQMVWACQVCGQIINKSEGSKMKRKNYRTMYVEIDYTNGPVKGLVIKCVRLNQALVPTNGPHYDSSWTLWSDDDTSLCLSHTENETQK